MIIVHVTVTVKEEQREAFTQMMERFIHDTRQVDSCQEFIFYQQIGETNAFALYEEWATATDFDAYTTTERFGQFRQALGPMIASPPISNRYEAAPLAS